MLSLSEGFSVSSSSCTHSSDQSRKSRSPCPTPGEEEVAKQLDLSLQIEMDTPRDWNDHGEESQECGNKIAPEDERLSVDELFCFTPRALADDAEFSEDVAREQREDDERRHQEEERKQLEQEIAAANKAEEEIAFNLTAAAYEKNCIKLPSEQTRGRQGSDGSDDAVSSAHADRNAADEWAGAMEERDTCRGFQGNCDALVQSELSRTDARGGQTEQTDDGQSSAQPSPSPVLSDSHSYRKQMDSLQV